MSDRDQRTARKRLEAQSRGGSVFKVNPANALGIESEQAKSKLIALALTNPANYHKLRDAHQYTVRSYDRQIVQNLEKILLQFSKF